MTQRGSKASRHTCGGEEAPRHGFALPTAPAAVWITAHVHHHQPLRPDSALQPDRGIRHPAMYQVTFSPQSLQELNKLDKLDQLDVVGPITSIKPSDLANPREPLGKFNRDGHVLYRLRANDFRFYFEVNDDVLHTLYILHKNSLEDFLLRNKLPVSESQLVEQHSKFWKYLETLTK